MTHQPKGEVEYVDSYVQQRAAALPLFLVKTPQLGTPRRRIVCARA